MEEVVEAVTAGHTFRKSHAGEVTDHPNLLVNAQLRSPIKSGCTSGSGFVDIILDMFPQIVWVNNRIRDQPKGFANRSSIRLSGLSPEPYGGS